MFTGIIKQTGTISKITGQPSGSRINVFCPELVSSLAIGDSVAVNGCCLTVESKDRQGFEAYISYQTLKNTTLGKLRTNDMVNLEEALQASGRLGGHMVTGHIDAVSRILSLEPVEQAYRIKIELNRSLDPFIAPRGSVAVDGISLTVSEKKESWFAAAIVPHTFHNTNLNTRQASAEVNIEVDLIARYVANFLGSRNINSDQLLEEKLKKYGFM